MSEWEDRLEDNKYEPVHNALKAGIKLLEKYYRRAMTQMHTSLLMVRTSRFKFESRVLYFSLVLDPVLKLEYIEATWDEKYLEVGMEQLKSRVIVLIYGSTLLRLQVL